MDPTAVELKTSQDAVNPAVVVEFRIVGGSLGTGACYSRAPSAAMSNARAWAPTASGPVVRLCAPTDTNGPAKTTKSEIVLSRAITALQKPARQHRLSVNTAIGAEEFAKNIASLRASIVMERQFLGGTL
jgi:hypothetical protein